MTRLIKIYTEDDGKYCSKLCPFIEDDSYFYCVCRLFNQYLIKHHNESSVRIFRSLFCKQSTVEKSEVKVFNLLSKNIFNFNVILYYPVVFCEQCIYCCRYKIYKKCKKYNCLLKEIYSKTYLNVCRCDECLHDINILIEKNDINNEDLK